MPNVTSVINIYASVLDLYPSGFRDEWLIIILPINPKKKVSKKRTRGLFIIYLQK